MKLLSYNVNGLRAASAKDGFWTWFHSSRADVIAIQETKAREEQLAGELTTPGKYFSYFSSAAVKKGYSGVAVYTKSEPLRVTRELPDEELAQEGRLLHLEFNDFHFLNVYFPNGQSNSDRLDFKLRYFEAFRDYARMLRRDKPVVTCGDFNIAHREIDLAQPELYEDISGFLPEERRIVTNLVKEGFLDAFRTLNGDIAEQYTWWSYRGGDRRRNLGWRIDYFLTSSELQEKLIRAWIEPQIHFSDHCPIGLELDL
ncbi:MAG: exodeoxyribonuclease III [Deltaproteobacteria bacterium]|jgi:exodeoxyribonuclease-3|nr:exodeoxyribonuclease III [Deltaproteobacteria bacterium]